MTQKSLTRSCEVGPWYRETALGVWEAGLRPAAGRAGRFVQMALGGLWVMRMIRFPSKEFGAVARLVEV